ncbi:putative protein kinase RLK-Pelle-LysM family [Helianthus annuus]|uniref:Protein kinase domain-containing protein n=1 Tax=Helianthus annuus TaxID=4232 RepID=A0A9K3IMS1_HELAN|nr:putative protein kinase RLK-Pelle-LysM family [Helianthus annuus]KAJ0551256.1 putative protein kinase RLK-Pelle-LysM family [Helianthus annuus]KAJ0564223.1 putative protein kinase RLK-Pelle-LysM family [Helianthus annuus]KAJ0732285.1 putative protein kinase RLK-Pelle-LysM family [Helianthus annuus]KAJ0909157.1 putative protein kinase RLK-Pelle-LysM family [Helianthus annuus]
MALTMLPLLALSALFVYPNIASTTPPDTNFTCSADSPRSCQTYLTYRARPPYANLGNISDMFGISRLSIAQANNLTSENERLLYDQLLLIPVKCSCNENSYFANVTHSIKKGDSFYVVATSVFQNLTNYHAVEDMNPSLNPTNLTVGEPVVFPLLCKCPALFRNQDKYLITYVWQPKDEILQVSSMFNTSSYDIVNENSFRNFTAAVCLPVLIPVSKLPIFPPPGFKSRRSKKGQITFIVLGTFGSFFLFVLSWFLIYKYRSHKTKIILARKESSPFEFTDFLYTKKALKHEANVPAKNSQDKLLAGVSGYLSKPIVYNRNEIMEAKSKPHEFSKTNGNYAENGSLDKWLFPRPLSCSSSGSSVHVSLSWAQRLNLALDIANGLHYMHEHSQPSIAHRDLRTSNILLDSKFKAKIGNFSAARPAISSIMLKVDVFAFGVILLELLSGKKAMETRDEGEICMAWKEIRKIIDVEDKREESLRLWMDPNLGGFYAIDAALNMAVLARACTSEKSADRPGMTEIVFNLSVFAQASSEMYERSWTCSDYICKLLLLYLANVVLVYDPPTCMTRLFR